MQDIIEIDSFLIRPLTEADLEPYYAMVSNNRKRLESFFTGTVSRTTTLEDTRVFLKEIVQKAENRTYFPFVIIQRPSGKFAGFYDLKNIDWNIPKAEMGCYMDHEFAGQGIARQTMILFCDYCFKEYRFSKLFLRTHESNTAARKVAEAAGFELEGVLRSEYKTSAGEIVDLMYYGKLNNSEN